MESVDIIGQSQLIRAACCNLGESFTTNPSVDVSYSDAEIAQKINQLFDLRPYAIEQRLKLRNPIYEETAAYGHMGREPRIVTKTYDSAYNGGTKTVEVELFTWEKLDYVDQIKAAFRI